MRDACVRGYDCSICDKASGLLEQSHLISVWGRPLANLKVVATKLPLILIAPM